MIRYLTEKEAIFINAILIKKYSPAEQVGVKDYALLSSAIYRPQASAFGNDAYPTIWEKGAALYASLTQNHCFHNANKRTGFAGMKQFFWLNQYQLTMPPEMAEEYTVAIVRTKPEITTIASILEEYTERLDK
jgi:death-on-curing protein